MSEVRPAGRALQLSGLPPGTEQAHAGGAQFVAYCMSGEVRAQQRRGAINRGWALHRKALNGGRDPYPTAMILCQRLGVAMEDVARLALAFEALRAGGDAFEALRQARLQTLDDTFTRLAESPEQLRGALMLPNPGDTGDLDGPFREAILAASDALAARWLMHWEACADGWQLLRRISKALRHGSPVLPRELVLGSPGAGALGKGLEDRFERWVLLVGTEIDHEAEQLNTTYAMGDLSDEMLVRARQAGLEAVSLARQLAGAHVTRVTSRTRWAVPSGIVDVLSEEHQAVLRKNKVD